MTVPDGLSGLARHINLGFFFLIILKKLSISKGGGLFDNPEKETTTIGEEIIVQEHDLKDNTYAETITTSMGEEQMNYSSYEKELQATTTSSYSAINSPPYSP